MLSNGHVGQVIGPFTKGQNLLSKTGPIGLILNQDDPVLYKIGIQAAPGTIVSINDSQIKIGFTGIYELEDSVKIKTLSFQSDTDSTAMVDFVYSGRIVY